MDRILLPTLSLFLLVLVAACDGTSTTEPPETPQGVEVGVVVNSEDVTLTVFEVDDPDADVRTIELGIPDGTPVGASVRGSIALVPMGVWPSAVVVDLASEAVLHAIPLPTGSGATGSIFLTDSTALVANPDLGTVTRVNVRRGTVIDEVEVGRYPQAFVETDEGRVAVVNAELVDFQPAGGGTLTVLDRASLEVVGTIPLSGVNTGPAVRGADGRVYVLHGGPFQESGGSLSVVDPELMEEVAHHEGFGHFPNGLAAAEGGRLAVSSWSFGVVVWDPAQEGFHRGLENPVEPAGIGSAAGVAADPAGRLYTLSPDCASPARVLRLAPSFEVEAEVPVGICPAGLVFTELDGG